DRIEGKELGRHWQAGTNIGVGLLFPRAERFEMGLRLRHLSNAGTDEFNWGVNQLLLRVGVRF
ncbi:MAG TPA: acyloxyacyl hydrolase, partial [Paracoccaceae bacterium]|nr:acyloxyacyl hydrolase [Paracoccaceae bacterium]